MPMMNETDIAWTTWPVTKYYIARSNAFGIR